MFIANRFAITDPFKFDSVPLMTFTCKHQIVGRRLPGLWRSCQVNTDMMINVTWKQFGFISPLVKVELDTSGETAVS